MANNRGIQQTQHLTKLIDWLAKHGIIVFSGSCAGSLALGRYGVLLGPAIVALHLSADILTNSAYRNNPVVKLFISFAKFIGVHWEHILQILGPIIKMLKLLWENVGEKVSNEKVKSIAGHSA